MSISSTIHSPEILPSISIRPFTDPKICRMITDYLKAADLTRFILALSKSTILPYFSGPMIEKLGYERNSLFLIHLKSVQIEKLALRHLKNNGGKYVHYLSYKCMRISEIVFRRIIYNCPNMEYLDVYGIELFDQELETITNLPNLTTLYYHDRRQFRSLNKTHIELKEIKKQILYDDILEKIISGKGLQIIDIANNDEKKWYVEAIVNFSKGTRRFSVKRLDMGYHYKTGNLALGFTSEQLKQLFTGFANIETVNLKRCVNALPVLSSLSLTVTTVYLRLLKLDDNHIRFLPRSLTSLTLDTLKGNSLSPTTFQHLTQLQTLFIWDYTGFVQFFRHLPDNITSLNYLTQLPSIIDSGLINSLPKTLTSLNLCGDGLVGQIFGPYILPTSLTSLCLQHPFFKDTQQFYKAFFDPNLPSDYWPSSLTHLEIIHGGGFSKSQPLKIPDTVKHLIFGCWNGNRSHNNYHGAWINSLTSNSKSSLPENLEILEFKGDGWWDIIGKLRSDTLKLPDQVKTVIFPQCPNYEFKYYDIYRSYEIFFNRFVISKLFSRVEGIKFQIPNSPCVGRNSLQLRWCKREKFEIID